MENMTHKPDAVEREMDFEPKRAWGEDLICSRCNEIIFENGAYVKAQDKIFCHVCVLDQAKINQKQLATTTAELKELREFVGAMGELLTHAHRIEFPLPDKNGEYFNYFTSISRYLGNPNKPYYNKWSSGIDDEGYDSPLDAFKAVMNEYGDRIRQIATGTDPFDAWRKMNAGEGE